MTIKYEDVEFNAGPRTTTSPPEVMFDPDTATFKIEKCSDAQMPFDMNFDPNCAMVPFEKNFRVWIETELVGEPFGAMNDQVNFNVEIGNVCETDVVSFD